MSKSVLLSGTEVAAEIRNSLKQKVLDIQKNDPSFLPKLVIVQVTEHNVTNVTSNGLVLRFAYFDFFLYK